MFSWRSNLSLVSAHLMITSDWDVVSEPHVSSIELGDSINLEIYVGAKNVPCGSLSHSVT